MKTSLDEIKEINHELGGRLLDESSLDFALSAARDKHPYQQAALVIRALTASRPFSDYNKRTALVTSGLLLSRNGHTIDDETAQRLQNLIWKLAASDEDVPLKNIKRGVRYAIERR